MKTSGRTGSISSLALPIRVLLEKSRCVRRVLFQYYEDRMWMSRNGLGVECIGFSIAPGGDSA